MMPFLKRRIESFKYAISGIAAFFRTQTHPKIHLIAAILVSTAGFCLNVSEMEWLVLILTIVIVLTAEAFNSAIELLCDKVSPEKDDLIKNVKDISAGAVLMAAIASVIVGIIIFLPKILDKLNNF